MHVAKTKAMISFAVTAKLICVFVFAYADCWFSHEAAHFFYQFFWHLMGTLFCFVPAFNVAFRILNFYCDIYRIVIFTE